MTWRAVSIGIQQTPSLKIVVFNLRVDKIYIRFRNRVYMAKKAPEKPVIKPVASIVKKRSLLVPVLAVITLLIVAALIGFIPAIGIFVVLYMGLGFRESFVRAGAFGAAVALFCYSVFDRGLSVPWPQSVLGDIFPMLREMTGLL